MHFNARGGERNHNKSIGSNILKLIRFIPFISNTLRLIQLCSGLKIPPVLQQYATTHTAQANQYALYCYTIMHIPFKLVRSSSSAAGLWTPPGFMLIYVHLRAVSSTMWEVYNAFTVHWKPLTSPNGKIHSQANITLHDQLQSPSCETPGRLIFLSQTAYLQNTVSLVLLFYGYFVYSSKRHLYLKCN